MNLQNFCLLLKILNLLLKKKKNLHYLVIISTTQIFNIAEGLRNQNEGDNMEFENWINVGISMIQK